MGSFQKLEDIEVWRKACRLAVDIYKLSFQEGLAKDWGLRDQIRRSAVSIPSNIAEGFERDSKPEFRRFLLIAKGFCGELRTQLLIIKALDIIQKENINTLLSDCIEISSMIQGLVKYLEALD